MRGGTLGCLGFVSLLWRFDISTSLVGDGSNRFWDVGDLCWKIGLGLLGYHVDAEHSKEWDTKRRKIRI